MKKTKQTPAERQAKHEARQAAAMAAFQSRTASVTMWKTPESQAAEERAAAKAAGTARAGHCLCGVPVADHFDSRNAKRDCAWAAQQTSGRIGTAGAQLQWRLLALAQGGDAMTTYRIEVKEDGQWVPGPGDSTGWSLTEARMAVAMGVPTMTGLTDFAPENVRIVPEMVNRRIKKVKR